MIYSIFENVESRNLGGKGENLFLLSSLGIKVPTSMVIPTDFFIRFLKETGLLVYHNKFIEGLVQKENVSEVQLFLIKEIQKFNFSKENEDKLYSFIDNLGGTKLAVRSSGSQEDSNNNSFAGIFDTYLNVEKKNVMESIKKCWSSLYSSKSQNYFISGYNNNKTFSMGVIIQEMIEAQKSGVCFTKNPISHSSKEYVIEVIFGLGAPLVDGSITPDTYIISIENRKIIKHYSSIQKKWASPISFMNDGLTNIPEPLQNKPKISQIELLELIDIARKIEENFASSQDIEFCIVNGKITILQTRPITT